MSKFNTKTATLSQRIAWHPAATTNYEGGLAFAVDPETALYLKACTSLLEDKFYTTADQELRQIRELIRKVDRKYVLQLANYARNAMHLRSLPILLLAEAANMESYKGEPKPDVRTYAAKILRRADEPAEVLAYGLANLWGGQKKTIPHALIKGIADVLKTFDEYELSKYERLLEGRSVKLRDVFRIARPKPDSPEQADLFRRAVRGELEQPEIWEIVIANAGRSAASKEERRAAIRDAWDQVAERMGILALLRNLSNFERYGAEKAKLIAIQRFHDPEAVRRSRILPFQWYTAYRHVQDPELRDAIQEALELSIANIRPLEGKTLILVDTSGSMYSKLSRHGEAQYVEIAALLAAMVYKLSPKDTRVGVFDEDFRWVEDVSRRDSIITNTRQILRQGLPGSTYAYKALETLNRERLLFDRIIVLSDEQSYSEWNYWNTSFAGEWEKYKRVNPNARLFSINMAGYSTIQTVPDDPNVTLLGGWSERVLDLIGYLERGSSIVDEIKQKW